MQLCTTHGIPTAHSQGQVTPKPGFNMSCKNCSTNPLFNLGFKTNSLNRILRQNCELFQQFQIALSHICTNCYQNKVFIQNFHIFSTFDEKMGGCQLRSSKDRPRLVSHIISLCGKVFLYCEQSDDTIKEIHGY